MEAATTTTNPPPLVIIVGNVGVGKSTVVEKITGFSGISSNESTSFTKAALCYATEEIFIIDTPGTNSINDKLQHNVWIAQAFNFRPVSLILVIVEANVRIDNTICSLREYLDRFQDFSDYICPVITKMDTVQWSNSEFMKYLFQETGISKSIFSGKNTSGQELVDQIKQNIPPGQPLSVQINGANFLKYFKINDNNLKILKHVRDEVSRFETINMQFECFLFSSELTDAEKTDLVFEYQAYMKQQIEEAKIKVANACGFTFMGDAMPNEIGHIANMANQMKNILFKIRTRALAYQSSHGVTQLRKCPYCGEIWTKVTGCDGATICGNLVGVIDARSNVYANFEFDYDENSRIFQYRKSGNRKVEGKFTEGGKRGCGRAIVWKEMAPVQIPEEFNQTTLVSVDDVHEVEENQKQNWFEFFTNLLSGIVRVWRIQ